LLAADLPGGLARTIAPEWIEARTQDLPPVYLPTGGAFAVHTQHLLAGGLLVADPTFIVPVPPERAADIDDASDLEAAERQLEGRVS
jgi:CMP-N-acetylneuraminic acid synthetase